MKDKYLANFVENGIYHVYNRTNNKELLFKTDENRLYFLRQFAKYLDPFLDTFCWTLLPNHFHFLVRVKNSETIKQYLKTMPLEKLKPIEKKYLENDNAITTELLIELEWKRFFNSYSMAFNKQHNRKGNLFNRPFKRILIDKESHFTQAIIYVHANAFKHGVCKNFRDYAWSSWKSITSSNATKLMRQEVLDWFGGLEHFIEAHNGLTAFYYGGDVSIEDE
jgi:REP element-mobilizing transposase RayT